MEYIDVRQFKNKVEPDAKEITFKDGHGLQRTVTFAYQKTGYGKKRFFCCPFCLKRVQKLYFVRNEYMCSECGGVNPYKGIKNNTKGGAEDIAYRMERYAVRYNLSFSFPFNYMDFAFDPRIGKQSFRKHLAVLQGLENMRFQSIMSKTTYPTKVLSSVIRGKHPLLQSQTLSELKNWFYDWNSGKRIIIDHPRQIIKI